MKPPARSPKPRHIRASDVPLKGAKPSFFWLVARLTLDRDRNIYDDSLMRGSPGDPHEPTHPRRIQLLLLNEDYDALLAASRAAYNVTAQALMRVAIARLLTDGIAPTKGAGAARDNITASTNTPLSVDPAVIDALNYISRLSRPKRIAVRRPMQAAGIAAAAIAADVPRIAALTAEHANPYELSRRLLSLA